VTIAIDNRSSAFPEIASPPSAPAQHLPPRPLRRAEPAAALIALQDEYRALARQHPEQPRRIEIGRQAAGRRQARPRGASDDRATTRLRPRLIDRRGKPRDNQKPYASLPPRRPGSPIRSDPIPKLAALMDEAETDVLDFMSFPRTTGQDPPGQSTGMTEWRDQAHRRGRRHRLYPLSRCYPARARRSMGCPAGAPHDAGNRSTRPESPDPSALTLLLGHSLPAG
jgi:hypothetical protein